MAHGLRVQFVHLEVESLPSNRCRCSVELGHNGKTYVGTAEGAGSEGERRAAAQAAVDALASVPGTDGINFKLLNLTTIEVFSTPAVIIALSVHFQDDWLYLVGFSLAKKDPPHAAVRAVLNSTNRFHERLSID